LALVLILPIAAKAQLPGPGNIDWQEVWVVYPPPSPSQTNPNYWMYGNNKYTSIAYDKWNDVVYIVNPATCSFGGISYKCPKIWAWDAETGVLATRIQANNTAVPAGQLDVNTNVVHGSWSQGLYALLKIDLDDQGRIYASNVVAPVFGICYPGPPPQCDPDYLSQGPYKIYRWDSPTSGPEEIFETPGNINNPGMNYCMWGTSFEVVGKEYNIQGGTFDSVRIFASGGKFWSGYVNVNDQMDCFLADTRINAPFKFRLGIVNQHNQAQSGFAAHGIAATGPYAESQIYVDANFSQVLRENQYQDPNAAMPQTYVMSLNQPLSLSVTGNAGPIKYYLDKRWNRPYLICADGLPSSAQVGTINNNTNARVVDLSTGPTYVNWPPTETPNIGNERFNNLTGEDNWQTAVDYKIWINDIPGDTNRGKPYLQLFVLMSKNGIACYRTRYPLPDPVDMTTFRGVIDGNDIALMWQIASESNNKGFEVYRSFNKGGDWEKIGFVNGRGTTSSPGEYTFRDPITDVHKNIGDVQYRLKQIDFDGKYTWTNAIDVFINPAPTSMTLYQNYPNPFNPSTKISYQLQESAFVTLKVFDVLGNEVTTLVQQNQEAGLHNVDFNANGLSSGTYVYQINANGQIQQKKMVLSK
jgi:hypothetical protein